ncbi:bifunctional 4-hydroxy-3-methylbut-2-enyl diphosphate reductase/30S ribosomal protein S1 [Caproiciproducens galactitolivorans]|uniref:4-hydroxy-3-methylbut-2-enyl diphosphate reductase n=1 Tax=Caproiciproducens galactitolivorans TaxID=642589 RepID=A0A4Z0YAU3_9FIRM|nr:bifunctional 4-hydroxy-3-methylbut-2-enyl diphosphate reductase/30S ribosomal protein S1 [Caproiciproducens galactitolivorans]QEY33948.1 bifunctional 4-hydroxy-3-methylbut-2-enyl diphosphate reductase/30S ribosomal protein S1 [Caproiciproducens galactitolivorans]TGJ76090.1 30S ribosomal protein S1 [Caproiciproducens galactitolivorans]
MKVIVARSAGYCFGVNRAIEMVDALLRKGKKVCTLGPIIHNPQTLAQFAERGVKIVDSPDEAPADATIVIRSHGVSKAVCDAIFEKKLECVDATCPFVAKIHKIVSKASAEGKTVLIAGDCSHPEVQGIRGHCSENCFVFRNAEELRGILQNIPIDNKMPPCVVAQTTFSVSEWENCLEIIKRVYTNATIFDTICNATAVRQSEAESLSRCCDVMIVIGGRQSSNTAKLRDVCRKNCSTYLIETADELPLSALKGAECIGITAGASTPASIIKEVLDTMSEINEAAGQNLMENNAEGNFEEMLEESLKNLNTDEKVRGVVVGITPSEVFVDVGRKQAGFIPASELSADPNVRPEDVVKIGDEMELLIMRTNDQEGTIMLSKKRLDAAKGWETVSSAEESQEVLTGVVTEIIKGGLIVVSHGVRVFIPASQATVSRGEPLDELLKKEVKFRVIEVNRNRRRAVGSIRSVLKDERKALAEKFWETAEEGKEYDGVVKSLTSYGAFVDLGGIDGMIHISELSWERIKHPSEVVNIGDTVHVYIKGLDREKGKISLGYKRAEDNPWEILKRDYPVGTVADVTIVGMTEFGAFARVIPGIDGLIHISQIADHRIEKPQDVLKVNEVVKAKITDIDFDKKRVSLSIRALLEPEEKPEETPAE